MGYRSRRPISIITRITVILLIIIPIPSPLTPPFQLEPIAQTIPLFSSIPSPITHTPRYTPSTDSWAQCSVCVRGILVFRIRMAEKRFRTIHRSLTLGYATSPFAYAYSINPGSSSHLI